MKENTRAFTLVELIAVIVVLSFIAAVALPRFFTTTEYNERLAFDEVLNSLRYAQKLAIGMGCHIRVDNNTANTITLLRRSSCTSGTFDQPVFDPVTNSSGYSKLAPGSVSITTATESAPYNTAWPFYFDALGRAHQTTGAEPPASFSVRVGSTRRVRVDGLTGFVNDPDS